MGVLEKIRETVVSHDMLKSGDIVIAGLSGGADSVCLLMCLKELSEEMGFELSAVHVNHCLRGDESERDCDFCVRLCKRLDVDIQVFRVDVAGYAQSSGKSVEEAARILRYEAFDKAVSDKAVSGNVSAKIATAHNKCDNSETVIFNMTRGTGIKGLCGIPYKRGNIIRPLLDASRDEIEDFLCLRNIEYVTDSTNLTDDYSRNKLRHQVIPVLRQINPSFDEAVSRLSASAYEDEMFFAQLIDSLSAEDVTKYPAAVRKRYIRRMLSEHGIEISCERLEILDKKLICGYDTRYELKGDIYAVFRSGVMTVEKIAADEPCDFCTQISLKDNNVTHIPEFDKTVKILGDCGDIFDSNCIVNKKLTNNLVNCDKIQGDTVLRNKRNGDSIVLRGRDFSTKLKKLFNEMKIPRNERSRALVIEDRCGIIWCEYGGAADRVSRKDGDDPCSIRAIIVTRRSE